MRHPKSRSERRFNGEVWRDRQRYRMCHIWFRGTNLEGKEPAEYWAENRMWWARKQSSGHGNRCNCHYEKYSSKEITKRRRALTAEIEWSLASYGIGLSEVSAHM